jgi:hypothetical protein
MADFRSTFTVVPQKRTFGLATFGLYSFQSATLAGPIIDLTYWKDKFDFAPGAPPVTFEHALHNMDPVQFVDLLYTEGFFSKDAGDAALYARGKGVFYPQTFRMQTFTGIPFKIGSPTPIYRGLASLAAPINAGEVPADTGDNGKWASTVAHEMRHLQPLITLEKLKPEGILSHLLLKPDGSLIKYWKYEYKIDGSTPPANDRGYKAMARCLERLSDIYKAAPDKILTAKTKANITARDGYNSSSSGTAETHYAYTWQIPAEQSPSPRWTPTNTDGRLLYDWGGFFYARVPFWNRQPSGASQDYPTLLEPADFNDTLVGDETQNPPVPRNFPVGYYGIQTRFDYSINVDSLQKVQVVWNWTATRVANGDFASGGTNWATTGSVTFTTTGDKVAHLQGAATLSQTVIGLAVGVPYRLQLTVVNPPSGSFQGTLTVTLPANAALFPTGQTTSFTAVGTYAVDFKLTSGTSFALQLASSGSTANLAVDNIALGASNYVKNGEFASSAEWSLSGAVSISGGKAEFSGVGTGTLSQTVGDLVALTPYRLKFTISNRAAGTLQVQYLAEWTSQPTSFTSDGDKVIDIKPPSGTTSLSLSFQSTASSNFKLDNVRLAPMPHGTFTLTFGGQTTDPLDGELPVRGFDDVISETTDLRYAIDVQLRGLSSTPQSPAGAPAVAAYYRQDSTESADHPLDAVLTKTVDVFFFNPARSGQIWPNGPGFAKGFGYFHTELSREAAMTSTPGTLPSVIGAVNIITNEFDDFHGYLDFLDDHGEPIRDEAKDRSVITMKNSNWSWWLYRFMDAWWGEFKALAVSPPATIDHLVNDHEQNFDFLDVRTGLRYGASRQYDNQTDQVKDFHAQGYFNTYWRPVLGQTISAKVGLGSDWFYSESDVSSTTLDYQVWTDVFRGAGRVLESKMLYSAVYQACAKHFPNVAVASWWGFTHSIGLIADAGIGEPIYQLGWVQGTHQSHSLFGAGQWLGAIGKHAINVPNQNEGRTWVPQSSAKIKRIKRDTEIIFGQSRGKVTLEVFNATDTNATAPPTSRSATQLQKGNDQYLNGLQVGHLVEVLAIGGLSANAAAAAAFWANDVVNPFLANNRMTKFAVTDIGHMNGNMFESGPDGDGNYTACQYIDVLHSSPTAWLECVVERQNRSVYLNTFCGWDIFLFNILQLRTMFLASAYPFSCWHGTESSGYYAAQQRQYRLEVYFHAWLHGETHRHWYNTPANDFPNDPYITLATRRDAEVQTWKAMQEMTLLCPWKDVKPLSINYTKPSIQTTDFVVSGASIPNNKRLFRVTLKDTQLVEFTGSGYARKYPKSIGHIRSGTDYEDFRTSTGRILRVPGQIKQPGGQPSNFTDFGWWVEASNPTP